MSCKPLIKTDSSSEIFRNESSTDVILFSSIIEAVEAQAHKRATVNATVIGFIPTQGK